MREDLQANLYAHHVIAAHGLASLDCRWAYYRTEGKPAALPVDFRITREGALERVERLAAIADKMDDCHIQELDARKRGATTLPLAQRPAACDAFGGCPYHERVGGPCHPPQQTPGEKLRALCKRAPTTINKQEIVTMGFQKKAEPEQIEQSEQPEQIEATPEQPEPPRRGRPPKSKAASDREIAIVSGDAAVPLPQSSPLYAKALAVMAALYPED